MASIFVVGSYVEGLTIRVPRMPALGESLVGDSFDMGPGGKGGNQAIAAARLGAEVTMLACIGEDFFGERALELYPREGIATDHIHRVAGGYTGIAFVNILPDGENYISVDMGANLQLTPQHVRECEATIASSDILMTQFEVPEDATVEALTISKAHGVTTVCNPAPARPTDSSLFANVDILTPNAGEARMLLGLAPDDPSPTVELARKLLDYGVGTVVVTLGAKGALVVDEQETRHIPALPIQAIDVTGAGDSFNAALAVFLGAGMSIADAARKAVIAGAYTAMHLGVIDGLPTRAVLERFAAESD